MHVLVLQHAPAEGPGILGDFLESHGVDRVMCRIFDGEAIPDGPGAASAILSLGGPQSVVAGREPPFFEAEVRLLAAALRRRVPILGICLGAQILARACGAAVRRAPTEEIGWFPLHLTADGLRDPLFRGVESPFEAFQWHGDTFDIPPGGVLLAEGEICRNQAFRAGRGAYGLQFHLEATAGMIREWMKGGAPEPPVPDRIRASAERTGRIVFLNLLNLIIHHPPVPPVPEEVAGGLP